MRLFTAFGSRPLLLGALAATMLGSGCNKRLPTAPSELTEGLVIYQDSNARGRSAHVTADIPDLEKVDGPCSKTVTTTNANGQTVTRQEFSWDNCVSSLRIAPGWRAVLYGDDNYRGGSIEVTADVADLKLVTGSCGDGFDDCVSSIRVFRP